MAALVAAGKYLPWESCVAAAAALLEQWQLSQYTPQEARKAQAAAALLLHTILPPATGVVSVLSVVRVCGVCGVQCSISRARFLSLSLYSALPVCCVCVCT